MSQEDAFAELRRCSETQFDPDLVVKFIEVAKARDENRMPKIDAVSKETAVRLGEQMERLAHAMDNEAFQGLAILAGRVNSTAIQQGVPEIADVAAELQAAACEIDLAKAVHFTNELLNLCRSVQKVHLDRIGVEAEESPDEMQVT